MVLLRKIFTPKRDIELGLRGGIAGALMAATLLSSCTKKFDSINTDPKRISEVSPGTLLNPIIYNMSAYNMQKADDFTFNLMQVALPYPSAAGGVHRYDIQENAGAGFWNNTYLRLTNINEMYAAAQIAEDPNYQAIALTLKAWILSNLTDAFGDIPFTEAAQAESGLLRPVFNSQQEVYTQLLADLLTANSLYQSSRTMNFGTDILFTNDVSRWKKFTNSLRMRLLLRVSKRAEMDSWTQLQTMVADPATYPVFTSNEEAAILQLSGITPLVSPWGRAVDFTSYRAAGKFFTDGLNAWNDPRLPKFVTQARSSDGSTTIGYEGIPSGYDGDDNQFNYIPSNVNVALVTAPMINPIFPYAELEFIKAELALQSGDLEAAQIAYEKGVTAAIEQWGATVPADYFTNPLAAFDGTLERVHQQKYYALYFVDYQQWFEQRRTGFPVLPKAGGMLNDQVLPVRYYYPILVRSANEENYRAAVSAMGGDNINIKVWWEK